MHLENLKNLKIVQLNAENLFLTGTTAHNSSTEISLSPKNADKTSELSFAIKDLNADIVLLCEVGGRESLDYFNGVYLDNDYVTSLIPGNSDRGIELGYLVHKRLNKKIQHFTHKEKLIGLNEKNEEMYFSRDLCELRILNKDSENPELIILHTHLKSKWDRTGFDHLGKKQRKKEVEKSVEIYLELKSKFPKTPIIFSGDFNGDASNGNGEDEFQAIFDKTDLRDVLDLIDLPKNLRTTFIHFERDQAPLPQQLDYIFMPESLKSQIDKENSGIYLYKSQEGNPLAYPQSSFERYQLPSDHYPVVLTLKSL